MPCSACLVGVKTDVQCLLVRDAKRFFVLLSSVTDDGNDRCKLSSGYVNPQCLQVAALWAGLALCEAYKQERFVQETISRKGNLQKLISGMCGSIVGRFSFPHRSSSVLERTTPTDNMVA